ncbi:MAG: hypothetical protein K2I00_01555 [Ruminococcus sp.]|nr:hypothetical protein [Ruminococcus sp.]
MALTEIFMSSGMKKRLTGKKINSSATKIFRIPDKRGKKSGKETSKQERLGRLK